MPGKPSVCGWGERWLAGAWSGVSSPDMEGFRERSQGHNVKMTFLASTHPFRPRSPAGILPFSPSARPVVSWALFIISCVSMAVPAPPSHLYLSVPSRCWSLARIPPFIGFPQIHSFVSLYILGLLPRPTLTFTSALACRTSVDPALLTSCSG